ncbi:neutral/alkaline non-lysosomal ceramidase N-terminal domain-containing protein [Bacillus suaedaesalsae]|uniref:Neutral/alkaline non-lysosomal ceramidase N-terminal domain-containing protein n=1 Tax=Bacillus suaedaesalsae TaxID=2810349 RepID=A0ABS2DHL4_9BACI|nr:neutral/alkaline non-lysosomal ceramidase N-terminal domain-containing protein [Bacillus suaedaesalsae]MBM6617976.1 neutral/alkaline non-lysosomal ceramidase N-terminal domain-containing protein [Bacillus suaedaesalsae]
MSKVGIHTINISPKIGTDFIGYHRPTGIQNVDESIFATAFVFQLGEKKSVIISVDNIGMLVEDTMVMREIISEKILVDVKDIMILFTHTHSGPATASNKEIIQSYKTVLIQQVVQAAICANERVEPCQAGWSVTYGQIGVNRREKTPHGKVIMGTNFEGIVDNRIGVLALKHETSENLLGVIVFCTAHPNVLKGDSTRLSADYPGKTRNILESTLGCPVIIVQCAAGNVNARWRGTEEDHNKMAFTLSGHVLTIVPELEYQPISLLHMNSQTIQMMLMQNPKDKDIDEMADYAEKLWGVNTKAWKQKMLDFQERGRDQLSLDLEIQLLQLNEGSFSGIPMEPFSETALTIKEELQTELAFFGGYTNGYIGYLPTTEEYPYGGYEVEINPVVYGPLTGLWMPPVPETADRIVHEVIKLYKK